MMRLIMILLLCLPGTLRAQSYPVIKEARPRIYFDSTRLAWLKDHIGSGECGNTFTRFRSAMYNAWYNDPQLYMLGEDSTQWTWTFSSPWAHDEAIYAAMLYSLTGDPIELKRCRFIIGQINARYDTLHLQQYPYFTGEDYIRWLCDVGGSLLDWCYDELPADMRQQLIQHMYTVARYFMQVYIQSPNGESYVSSHNAWNNIFANQFALVLNGADGLSAEQQDTIQQWYEVTLDKWKNGFEPVYAHYRDDDGGWNWGAAYAMWSLIDQFQFFENMRIATEKDYFHDLPWVANSINQYWHFLQPDHWTINLGDGFTDLHADRVVYLHARYFQDPRSQWLAQFWSQPPYLQLYNYTAPLYRKLMYYDFEMETVAKPAVPLDWWSDKTGLSVSRTAWDTSAALVWFFNSPAKKAAHEHRDNNTFSVFKFKPQIIHSGYYNSYGNFHYVNYYMRTIAHNSICVYDSADQYKNWGVTVSNDGGQIESPTLYTYEDIFDPSFQRGEWLLWGAGENYCYSIADAAKSYDPAKVSRFTRRVLFHKPDRVLVLDHMDIVNPGLEQRDISWVLHFQNQPQLSGALLTATVPGHIETYNGKDVYQANGRGNVSVRTLLPVATTISRIGGNGYEFYVDGVNYPVLSAMDTLHTTPGRWRIEVKPDLTEEKMVFFHTIKIGDDLHPSTPGGLPKSNATTLGTDWDNTLYFFSTDGNGHAKSHFMDSVPGSREVFIFAADLEPLTGYDVQVDEIPFAENIPADSNGILQWPIEISPGIHQVKIVHNLVERVGDVSDQPIITMMPNPVGDKMTLFIAADIHDDVRITVFNATGICMFEKEIVRFVEIDVSSWPPGEYFLTAGRGRKFESKTFIVTH